jgi:hypothetical protein
LKLAKEMRRPTTANIGAELLRRASEVAKVAETFRNLKGTYVEMLRDVARSIAAGETELARRTGPALGTSEIMEGHVAALETENEVPRKDVVRLVSRSTVEKSCELARLAALERKMEELEEIDGGTPPRHR